MIRTVKTLDQLTKALNCEGFELKGSSVYLHLLPWNHMAIDRKKLKTAPVKLYKSQNWKQASHPSTKFARASIKSLEELAAMLAPAEVTFHSQDDKKIVPIGQTTANKEAPMLMHMKWWWWWWIAFVVWFTNKRRLALFPPGTIVRDPHHHKCPTHSEPSLNLRRTWVQA